MKDIIHKIKALKKSTVLIYLLAAILITIPLNFAYGSISCIAFLTAVLFYSPKEKLQIKTSLLLPMMLYLIMALSLLWTKDFAATVSGLKKEVLFILMPMAFLFIPGINKESANKIFRIFGFSMALYGLYSFFIAALRFLDTGSKEVFFYHELVTVELNAIYMGAFASFGMFYFISLKGKRTIDHVAMFILIFFVFLLSSKIIFLIDFFLIAFYYIFFSKTPPGVKVVTIFAVIFFICFSAMFVGQVRERFLLEYETAFVDNTVNENFGSPNEKVYNVSLNQAWNNESFRRNNFFPGTALRVFQVRIFKEMLQEQNILYTGFGHEASQKDIEAKIKEHKLYLGYSIFNFHNQYVQTFAELGIIGFLILVVMLCLNLRNALRHKNFMHIVFGVTMIILLLTESILCRQRGIIFFITLYCIFNSWHEGIKNKNERNLSNKLK